MEEELKKHAKTYEFHSYEGAGHAFFWVERPSYNAEAARDGWHQIWDVLRRPPGGLSPMCTYLTSTEPVAGTGLGAKGWFPIREAVVYFDHPQEAPVEHALCIDFRAGGADPSERVAVELDAAFGPGARRVDPRHPRPRRGRRRSASTEPTAGPPGMRPPAERVA